MVSVFLGVCAVKCSAAEAGLHGRVDDIIAGPERGLVIVVS